MLCCEWFVGRENGRTNGLKVFVVDLRGVENSDSSMDLVVTGGTLLKDNVLPPS